MNRLRELRQAADMSAEELAVEMDLGAETVKRWERGAREIPTAKARWLAARFGVSLSHLLCDEVPA